MQPPSHFAARLALHGAMRILLTSFKRMRGNIALKPHKDGYCNDCFGRRGMIVAQDLV